MNNTINNVPRELLERAGNLAFQTQHYPLHEELRALLSSPAYTGEDWLEADCKTCNGHGLIGDAPIECPDCCADDATATIDGLRLEVAELVKHSEVVAQLHADAMFAIRDLKDANAVRIEGLERLLTRAQIWIVDETGPGWELSEAIDAALSSGKEGAQ